MQRIEKQILELRQFGRDAFLSSHNSAVFVTNTRSSGTGEWSQFHTGTLTTDTLELARALAADGVAIKGEVSDYRVIEISKAPGSPWRGRTSVGRARNSDVTVLAPSVSKLHAHILKTEEGAWGIADAGSRNGTSVNGTAVSPGMTVPLNAGDSVSFGNTVYIFHTPESYCEFLLSFLQG